jgi:hypothetical protein
MHQGEPVDLSPMRWFTALVHGVRRMGIVADLAPVRRVARLPLWDGVGRLLPDNAGQPHAQDVHRRVGSEHAVCSVVVFDPRDQSRAYTEAIERSALKVLHRDPLIVVAAR